MSDKTVTLDKADVLRLITHDSDFWRGCDCASCEATRIKVASVWPDLATDFTRHTERRGVPINWGAKVNRAWPK